MVDYKTIYNNNNKQRKLNFAARLSRVGIFSAAFVCVVIAIGMKKHSASIATISIPCLLPSDKSNTVAVVNDLPLEDDGETGELKWHQVIVRRGDTLNKIFTRLGIPNNQVNELNSLEQGGQYLANLVPGQVLKLAVDSLSSQLMRLSLEIEPGSQLDVAKSATGFQAEHNLLPEEKILAYKSGRVKNSLFLAGKRAGLDSNVIAQMVDIFAWNVDFEADLLPHDTFRVLYEEVYRGNRKIQTGHVLAVEITTQGNKRQAILYKDKSGKNSYFSPEGHGMYKAFLRAPVSFSRISSRFGPRLHPIMHRMHKHQGVDYKAPHGTPVYATADGKVNYVGRRGGYGNVVELQHGARYTTLYGHLSRFAPSIRSGKTVRQGEIIGYVGRTGMATGDHLHYEFRIDGVHRDPLTVALPNKTHMPEHNKKQFVSYAKEMLRLLDYHENSKLAQNDYKD